MAAQTRFEEVQHQKDVNMEGGNLMGLHPYTKSYKLLNSEESKKKLFPRDKFPNLLSNISWNPHTHILKLYMNVYELIYVQVRANWANKGYVFILYNLTYIA